MMWAYSTGCLQVGEELGLRVAHRHHFSHVSEGGWGGGGGGAGCATFELDHPFSHGDGDGG